MPHPSRQAAVVASAESVGTMKTPLPFHHGRGFFVHERGMLDRMDSGTDGIFHPRRSMGMCGDFPSSSLRFIHGGLEFLHGHLRLVRRGAGCEDAA